MKRIIREWMPVIVPVAGTAALLIIFGLHWRWVPIFGYPLPLPLPY